MREDRIDEEIRRLLQEATEDYDESSWEKLSQRIDAEDLSTTDDAEFDDQVKYKLERHTIPPSEEHWQVFNEELDRLEQRRRRVYVIKVLEATIFLLLVMTFLNYTQFRSKVDINNDYISQVQKESADINAAQASLAQPITPKTLSDLASSGDVQNRLAQRGSESVRVWLAEDHETKRVAFLPLKSISALSSGNHQIRKVLEELLLEANQSYAVVPSLDIGELSVSRDLPSLASLPVEEVEKENNTDGWSFSLPISYDVNIINTQLDLDYLSHQIESGLAGQSFGARVGYRKGAVEIGSGILYSKKAFVPGRLTSFSKASNVSFLRNQLRGMYIRQMEIPLHAKVFMAPPQNKASLYVLGGVSTNFIIHNQYLIDRTPTESGSLSKAPNVDLIDLQNLPRAIVQGGSLADNVYLTGMIGLGVEARVSEKIRWYIQPTYRHALTGQLNPLVDRISTLSVEAGVTYKM